MAIATIVEANKRFDLKSAPPDGYVVIRRMTWGEKLKRQGMLTQMSMEIGRDNKDDIRAQFDMLQEKVSLWEFANLVIEHNLTDSKEKLLNFKNYADTARLGPKVGEEIQKYIDEMNAFEDSDEVKN